MEEFAKIKDEVPSAIMDAHMKNVKEAVSKDGVCPNNPALFYLRWKMVPTTATKLVLRRVGLLELRRRVRRTRRRRMTRKRWRAMKESNF